MSPNPYGRPKVENRKDVRFSIRLDEETSAKLDAWCAEHHTTRAKAIRLGIDRLLAAEEKE